MVIIAGPENNFHSLLRDTRWWGREAEELSVHRGNMAREVRAARRTEYRAQQEANQKVATERNTYMVSSVSSDVSLTRMWIIGRAKISPATRSTHVEIKMFMNLRIGCHMQQDVSNPSMHMHIASYGHGAGVGERRHSRELHRICTPYARGACGLQ